MTSMTREQKLEQVFSELDDPDNPMEGESFFEALGRLRELAQDGSIDAAILLGEILAYYGPAHDPGEAYKWYYIGLSQTGYSVAFEDTGAGAPFYCGPVGDFRNESMVSDLVERLGIEKIRQLDAEAAAWLDSHNDRW